MRRAAIVVLIVLAAPAALLAKSTAPTTAPGANVGAPSLDKARSGALRVGALVADLFNQTHDRQQQARCQLEAEPDLPALLASLLGDHDPAVQRTSLLLIRDRYGDWAVVAAVQTMLQNELARGPQADGNVVAACCQILADWPLWDSVPVLLGAIGSQQQVAGQSLPPSLRLPSSNPPGEKVAVWREADAALRLVSGEWPMPEPNGSADPTAPGSPLDRAEQQKLLVAWGEWWAGCCSLADPLPQVRVELTWTAGPAGQPDQSAEAPPLGATTSAGTARLWVRPTGSVYYSRTLGMVAPGASLDEPTWKWADPTKRRGEFRLNALQADAVRTLAGEVAAAAPATTWAISRPSGLPTNWRARLQIISPFGGAATVDLAEVGTLGATRTPTVAAEAITELLAIPAMP